MIEGNKKCSECGTDMTSIEARRHADKLAQIRLDTLEEAARECEVFLNDHMICETAKAAYRVAAARIRRLFNKKT